MRGVLWCNGSIPTESVVEWVLTTGAPVFGVDGGCDKAHSCGIEVFEVLGDMDSLDESAWKGRTLPLNEQTFSDLAKSIRELIHRGFDEIEIVGADGGDPSHILGNWAAMNDAPSGARIRIHHEEQVSTRLHPDDEGFSAEFEEESCSLFSLLRQVRSGYQGPNGNYTGMTWAYHREAVSYTHLTLPTKRIV